MPLDFITLYVIILINSASFALVWAVIALTYHSLTAARHWLAALLMTFASGPLLFLGDGHPILAFFGLTLVAGSFAMIWQGLRVFYGNSFRGLHVLAIMAATMAALLGLGTSQEAINVIAAVSQSVPVLLAIATLLRGGSLSAGVGVATAAALVVVIGQTGEGASNLMRLTGTLGDETYYGFAALFLLCAIVGGSVWNIGFLLMAADRYRASLVALAKTDELTGLANRRGLRERMLKLERNSQRSGAPVVLMMIDMDRFKSINDGYGHAAGDAALAHVANTIHDFLEDDQFAARIGGDEFCMLLPRLGGAEAQQLADRLARRINRTPLKWNGHQIALSASIGLTEWRPGRVRLVDGLDRADDMMFKAKRLRQAPAALALSA